MEEKGYIGTLCSQEVNAARTGGRFVYGSCLFLKCGLSSNTLELFLVGRMLKVCHGTEVVNIVGALWLPALVADSQQIPSLCYHPPGQNGNWRQIHCSPAVVVVLYALLFFFTPQAYLEEPVLMPRYLWLCHCVVDLLCYQNSDICSVMKDHVSHTLR